MEIALLAKSFALSVVESSSFRVRPLEERAGQARPGPLGPVSGKPCHPGLLSEAGFG